jgi:hypothetical protein
MPVRLRVLQLTTGRFERDLGDIKCIMLIKPKLGGQQLKRLSGYLFRVMAELAVEVRIGIRVHASLENQSV